MKLMKFVKFGESVISDIERAAKVYEIKEKDIDEFGKFLKTAAAKQLDDFATLERIHVFCKIFMVHERVTEKPKVKRGRGRPPGRSKENA